MQDWYTAWPPRHPVCVPTHQSTFAASEPKCNKETGRWAESTVRKSPLWPSSDHLSGAGPPGPLLPIPWCCRFQHRESVSPIKALFAPFAGYREASSCGTPTPVHTYINISQPQWIVSLHLLLLVNGRHRTRRLKEYNSFYRRLTDLTPLHLPFHTLKVLGGGWLLHSCILTEAPFFPFFPTAPQDP